MPNPFDDLIPTPSASTATSVSRNPFDDLVPTPSPAMHPLRRLAQTIFGPSEAARRVLPGAIRATPGLEQFPTLTDIARMPSLGIPNPMLDPIANATGEAERNTRAQLLAGLMAAPLDPTTYAFLGTSQMANIPARVALSSAIGAAPGLAFNRPLPEVALQAAVAGGLSALPTGAKQEARPPTRPSFAPESVWIPGEGATVQEAADAAQEGFGMMQRPQMPPPPVSMKITPQMELEAYGLPGGVPPGQELVPVKTTPSVGRVPHSVQQPQLYQPMPKPIIQPFAGSKRPDIQAGVLGELPSARQVAHARAVDPLKSAQDLAMQPRIPRTRGNAGFMALPEEEQAAQAGRQVAARAVATSATASERLQQEASRSSARLKDVSGRLAKFNKAAEIVAPETDTIAATGTVSDAARPALRAAGGNPSTLQYKFAEADIRAAQQDLVTLGRDIQRLRYSMGAGADPLSANAARAADDALRKAVATFNQRAVEFRKLRFAAGRAVKTFDRPPVPADVIAAVNEAGAITEGLQSAKAKLPIYTNIVRSVKNYRNLTPAEAQQLGTDLIDAWRLNLFSVTSWTLDLVGNAAEVASQVGGGIGRDLGHVVQGRLTFPSLQGFIRAMRGKTLPEQVMAGIAESATPETGVLAAGGFRKGPGTFTTRTTPASTALDYLVGTPLYAKGVTDNAARRFAASAHLWRKAIEHADRMGLRGMDRRAFYETFWKDTPQEVVEQVVREGNKAGFNRTLSRWEVAYASNPIVKLTMDPFARWGFQFWRAMGEWMGYNPELWARVKNGTARIEDISEYLGKSATGYGGLMLIDQLYDRVDFNSMEYVHENGNRTRLSGREPLTTGLWLLATVKGDLPKSTGALQYASIPFAKFVSDERGGGLLSSTVKLLTMANQQGQINPRAAKREVDDFVNRLIPGQALLSAIKTVFDDTIREGVGANLPGVSQTLPAAINPTTGGPLKPTQRVLGSGEFPTIGGTPIPGAERVMDPVQQLLSQFGMMVYRGPRTPIAGVPVAEVPEAWRREWLQLLGQERQRLLRPIAVNRGRIQAALKNPTAYEALRKEISNLDAQAARTATQRVQQRYGGKRAVPRKPTLRERRAPEALQP